MAVHNDMFGVQPPLTLDDFKHCTWMGHVLARARGWSGQAEDGAWVMCLPREQAAEGAGCRGRKEHPSRWAWARHSSAAGAKYDSAR